MMTCGLIRFLFADAIQIINKYDKYRGWAKKRGHIVLRLVTLEVLITSAPNLAEINAISYLTLPRNLLEITLENKVAPSIEPQ